MGVSIALMSSSFVTSVPFATERSSARLVVGYETEIVTVRKHDGEERGGTKKESNAVRQDLENSHFCCVVTLATRKLSTPAHLEALFPLPSKCLQLLEVKCVSASERGYVSAKRR